jgi:hypothetical protein
MSATPEEPVETAGTTDAQVVTDVPQPSFFSSSAHERLRRRPSDLLLAAACVCAIAALVLLSPASAQLEAASAALVDSLPGILRPVWLVGWGALVVWALVLLLAAAVRPGRRTLLLHCLVGAALGCLVAVVARSEPGGAADALAIVGVVGFLICCAVVVTASPHLARPYRRAGRVLLVWAAVSLVLLGTPPVAVTVALLAGSLGAALAHLAFGSPGGRPTVKHVKRALAELGVEVVDLAESGRQVPAETRFDARAPDGSTLAVTVLGRDAWDSQFLTSIWTALWRRGERPHIHRSRCTLVEHQAMALLIAQRAGVSVAPLVGVGTSSEGDAILVTRAGGRSLRDAGPDDVSDDALREAWRQLLALHAAGVSHGNIDMDRLQLSDGAIVLTDFRDAAVPGLPQDLFSDRARLLVAGALACGQDRAISAAVSALGREGLADVLGYVQPPVVGRSMRRDVRERPWKLNDLLAGAAAACDVPAPEPAPVARMSARSLAASAFFVVVAWALLSWLLTLDFAAIWSALLGADWAVLGLALALSPLIQPGLALATLGSSLARLRYGPALMLEYAIQFISLTLPSTAARVEGPGPVLPAIRHHCGHRSHHGGDRQPQRIRGAARPHPCRAARRPPRIHHAGPGKRRARRRFVLGPRADRLRARVPDGRGGGRSGRAGEPPTPGPARQSSPAIGARTGLRCQ